MTYPKTLAYYPLHYGAEYLSESLQSIASYCAEIIFLYTAKPSYGFSGNVPCPETRDHLENIISKTLSKYPQVKWRMIDVDFGNEGEHRHEIWKYTKGFDLVLAVDGDEVWSGTSLRECLNYAHKKAKAKYIGISGFVNFWRSFNHACYDSFCPIRIYKVNAKNNDQEFIEGKVYHFSCAQSEAIMRYKYEIHGHKEEIRPDWLEKIYFGWTPDMRFLHPVSLQIWGEALPFNKYTLPSFMKMHPNFNKEKI